MDTVDEAFTPASDQSFPAGITAAVVNEQYSTALPVSLNRSTKVTSEHLALEYGETFEFPVWINRCGVMQWRSLTRRQMIHSNRASSISPSEPMKVS